MASLGVLVRSNNIFRWTFSTLCALAICVGLDAGRALAQQDHTGLASLVADRMAFSARKEVIEASGNVEITYGETRLKAQSLRYDKGRDKLELQGPIYITDASGTIIAADAAQLDGQLRNGVLESARFVYDQQMQLAAREVRRTEGRYTEFYKSVASSCHICEGDSAPLWELRAKRIVHDDAKQQLYFRNATLRVLGVPVIYTPYLRLPDPSVKRSNGFLIPDLHSNGKLGIGLKTPYFFTLGDHADVTLTPWFTSKNAKTLETRYRQKFRYGDVEVTGALTKDDNSTAANVDARGYLFANGTFDLVKDFTGKFDLELVSDPGYLLLYGYSDKDRLDSAISVERARRDQYIGAEVVHYKSIRSDANNHTSPSLVGDASYIRRFTPEQMGGTATFSVETHGHYRRADQDPNNLGQARDVMRLSAGAEWYRGWTLTNGMLLTAQSAVFMDGYTVLQPRPDPALAFDDSFDVTPYGALKWRWPMLKQTPSATHLLEPVAQLVLSKKTLNDVENEDSRLVEFDEANLFSFSRTPGADRREVGNRVNLGLTYTRKDRAGWGWGLTVGRIFRDDDQNSFNPSTGLNGKSSDWLLATQLKIGDKLHLINRSILDDTFSLARNEMRMSWQDDRLSLGSTYVWLEADEAEDRPINTSEFAFDTQYRLTPNWTAFGAMRYDFVNDQTTRARLGMRYQNECAQVDLSVSRRFTTSTSITPTTDLSLSVQLAGFGARNIDRGGFSRQCRS